MRNLSLVRIQQAIEDEQRHVDIHVRRARHYMRAYVQRKEEARGSDFYGDESDTPDTLAYQCHDLRMQIHQSMRQLEAYRMRLNRVELDLMRREMPVG